MYLEPGTVIRSVGNPVPDANTVMDPNFEIADLPVKLELRYVIESKLAAHGMECPKSDYHSKDLKNQQVLWVLLHIFVLVLRVKISFFANCLFHLAVLHTKHVWELTSKNSLN